MRICGRPAKTDRLAAVRDNCLAWGRHPGKADIAELEQLAEQLSQSYPGASMDDVDLTRGPVSSATRPPSTVTLAELERALVNQAS